MFFIFRHIKKIRDSLNRGQKLFDIHNKQKKVNNDKIVSLVNNITNDITHPCSSFALETKKNSRSNINTNEEDMDINTMNVNWTRTCSVDSNSDNDTESYVSSKMPLRDSIDDDSASYADMVSYSTQPSTVNSSVNISSNQRLRDSKLVKLNATQAVHKRQIILSRLSLLFFVHLFLNV